MGKKRPFRSRVGRRIAERRRALGLSQGALARRLPGTIEGGQVSRWERGENFPSYENVVALARALGTTEEELICGCEPPPAARSLRRVG